jgi:membrane protein
MGASKQGEGLQTSDLQLATTLTPITLLSVLEILKLHRYIARGEDGEWRLAHDLESVTLATLHDDLDMRLLPADRSHLGTASWGRRYAELAAAVDSARNPLLGVSLRQLFDTADSSSTVDHIDGKGAEETTAENDRESV